MSVFDTMAWAKRQQTGSVARKAVLMALAERTGEEPVCWPTQALLAEETEQSVRTIRTRLEELEAAGLIQAFRPGVNMATGEPLQGRKGVRNAYRLMVDGPADQAATEPEPEPAEPGTNRQTDDDQAATGCTTKRQPVAGEVPQEVPLPEHPLPPSSLPLGAEHEPREKGPPKNPDGQAIARDLWDQRKARGEPVPALRFIAVVKIAQSLVDAGHTRETVLAGMLAAPTISTGAVEFAIARHAPRKGARSGGPGSVIGRSGETRATVMTPEDLFG